jgi:hypothetical protein
MTNVKKEENPHLIKGVFFGTKTVSHIKQLNEKNAFLKYNSFRKNFLIQKRR